MLEHEFLIRYHSLNALLNKKVTFNKSAIKNTDDFVELDEEGNPIHQGAGVGKLLMILGGTAELFVVIADSDGKLIYLDTEKSPIFGVNDAVIPPVTDPPPNLPV